MTNPKFGSGSDSQDLCSTIEGLAALAKRYRTEFDSAVMAVESFAVVLENSRISGNLLQYGDPYFLMQLAGGARGTCFGFPEDLVHDTSVYLGASVFDLLGNCPAHIAVCALDAIYWEINRANGIGPSSLVHYAGTAAENGATQARVLADLAGFEAQDRVALIGVVEDIVREILNRRALPVLADLLLAGETCLGIDISADANEALLDSQYAIISGNTLKTRTLDQLLSVTASRGIRSVVYAMSGASIAPQYLSVGADAVTVEQFPFFWYSGLGSTIQIFDSLPQVAQR